MGLCGPTLSRSCVLACIGCCALYWMSNLPRQTIQDFVCKIVNVGFKKSSPIIKIWPLVIYNVIYIKRAVKLPRDYHSSPSFFMANVLHIVWYEPHTIYCRNINIYFYNSWFWYRFSFGIDSAKIISTHSMCNIFILLAIMLCLNIHENYSTTAKVISEVDKALSSLPHYKRFGLTGPKTLL